MTRDPIVEEWKAALNRRNGVRPQNEPPDPHRAETRRRLEELAEAKRLKEATEWL